MFSTCIAEEEDSHWILINQEKVAFI